MWLVDLISWELWSLHVWDHLKISWLGSYGWALVPKGSLVSRALLLLSAVCIIFVSSHKTGQSQWCWQSFWVTFTHAGHSMSWGTCGTHGLPLLLGLHLWVWTHVLALGSSYYNCRVTSSLQHLKAAGMGQVSFMHDSLLLAPRAVAP